MYSRITTAPAVEPITLTEVKRHLRIKYDDADTHNELTLLIQAAREHIEFLTGRALVQQTRTINYAQWPASGVFELPYAPLQSVTKIDYTDVEGTTTTFSTANYSVDTGSEPGRIVLGYNKTWPTSTLHPEDLPIEIEYVCGYAPTTDSPPDYRYNIPEALKIAIKFEIELRYDRPMPDYADQLKKAIQSLIINYRDHTL